MKFEYSAGAFVYKISEGKVLMLVLKRGAGRRGTIGAPDMPKGHIERGESAEEAAKREIMEETGLTPFFLPSFREKTTYFFRDGGDMVRKELVLFIADAGTQKVRISHEHIGYQWLDYDTAKKVLVYKDIQKILPRVVEYIGRWEKMKILNEEYARLPSRRWGLSKRLVCGEGRLDAKIMILGQAPGRNEDFTGRPFIGRSGKLLDTIMKRSGIARNDAYITSVVQFFPPDNRMPSRMEMAACKPFLFRQIAIVKPKVVVLLGDVASMSVLGIGEVKKNHGRIIKKSGVTYMITFHPAAALRSTGTLRIMERDFDKLRIRLK